MIRPAVAGAVPVKVDEASIKDIPGAQGRLGQGLPRRRRRQGMGRHQGRGEAEGRMVGRRTALPGAGHALRPHPQGAGAQAEIEKQNGNVDDAFKTAAKVIEAEYEWPFQSHASMGPACALVEIKDGKVTCWSGTQKSHFVQQGIADTLGVPVDNVRVDLARAPAPTAATTPTTPRWTPPCWRRRSASRCACNTCATRAPAGTRKARPRSTRRAPRIDASGKVIAYEFISKALLARRRRHQRQQAVRYAGRAGARRRAEVRRRLRHPGGVLCLRQQARGLGDHPAAARPLVAAAHVASARSGRAADPLRQRVLHGRSGGGDQRRSDRVPAAPHQGCARRRA